MESTFHPLSTTLTLFVALCTVALTLGLAIGIVVAGEPPSSPDPAIPPALHVFNSDLTIHSPYPVSTPTDINDWLHQVAH